jgi:hypothetical protein
VFQVSVYVVGHEEAVNRERQSPAYGRAVFQDQSAGGQGWPYGFRLHPSIVREGGEMILQPQINLSLETKWQRGDLLAVGTNRRIAMILDKAARADQFWATVERIVFFWRTA